MKKNYYREKYNKNTDMLKKLYKMLDKVKKGIDVGYDEETIIEAIEEIKEEQNYYVSKLRKNMYNRYGKMFTCEKKYELYQPEFIERENEIIIQANSIDEYVTEIVEDESVDQIEVVKNEEKCDNQTDILTSKEKCDDKTDVLTSEDKSCDDKTDVLTSDAKTEVLTSTTVDKKDNLKKKNMFQKFKVGLTSIATAAVLLLGAMGASGKFNKNRNNNNDNSNDSSIEYTMEVPVEDIETITEVEETNDKSKDNEDNTFEVESTDNVIVTELSNDEEDDNVIIETPNEEEFDLKIGDTVSLDNVDLYKASTDENANGNTINLKNCIYKAKLLSVVHDNQVMELVYSDSISLTELENICKDKYGDDFEIFINYDVVDKDGNVVSKYVGWVRSNDAKTKSKTLK